MKTQIEKYMNMPFKERMAEIGEFRDTNQLLFKAIMKQTHVVLKEERERKIDEYWETLPKFKDHTDVPKLPKPLTQFHIDKLIECGAIAKKDLIIGKYYYGNYRITTEAKWLGNEFEYEREKFGHHFKETCFHFEDDDGFAVFTPLKIINK